MQMKHKCPDGVVYKWEAKKAEPKACPRCKSRLDIKYGAVKA